MMLDARARPSLRVVTDPTGARGASGAPAPLLPKNSIDFNGRIDEKEEK
jgi:hypothetical protein